MRHHQTPHAWEHKAISRIARLSLRAEVRPAAELPSAGCRSARTDAARRPLRRRAPATIEQRLFQLFGD
jgi:hypothetical protein